MTRPSAEQRAGIRRHGLLGSRTTTDDLVRVAAPLLLVAGTLVLADRLRWLFPGGGLFLVLLVPVLLASVAFGTRAGAAALLLGAVGALAMVPASGHPWLSEPVDGLRLVAYIAVGGATVLSAGRLHPEGATAAARVAPRRRRESRLIEPLTSRETEVLGLAASGLSTHEIARRLHVSRNTVKSHLGHAYGKLGAHNRTEAVAIGLHAGAIDLGVVTSRAPTITRSVTRSSPRPSGPGEVRSVAAWRHPAGAEACASPSPGGR